MSFFGTIPCSVFLLACNSLGPCQTPHTTASDTDQKGRVYRLPGIGRLVSVVYKNTLQFVKCHDFFFLHVCNEIIFFSTKATGRPDTRTRMHFISVHCVSTF